mmetsp:Transcript_10225/g.24579  ORF Transcript_10225/g.24579 Transcript_10225/m.24579 type:complete len:221 (+) Transcript_10225:195-857(+)
MISSIANFYRLLRYDINVFLPSVSSLLHPRKLQSYFVFGYRWKYGIFIKKLRFLFLEDRTRVGCDTGPKFGAFLRDWSTNGTTFHLTLVVDDDTGRVFKVDEDTLLSTERLTLTDDDTRHDFLSKFRLSLLDGTHDHVTGTCLRETIQPSTDVTDRDNVKVLRTAVVTTVDSCSDWKTRRYTVLDPGRSSTSTWYGSLTHIISSFVLLFLRVCVKSSFDF